MKVWPLIWMLCSSKEVIIIDVLIVYNMVILVVGKKYSILSKNNKRIYKHSLPAYKLKALNSCKI